MNGTDRASHYPYHHYHQHPYQRHQQHHLYQQRHHSHHPLPSLAAAAAAGSFPFSFDADSPPTGGRPVDPAAGTGSRVFATPPLSTTGPAAECCYHIDEGMRRYASDGVVAPSAPATAAAYLGFRSSSTRRPNVDSRFASASIPAPEMTSQTASPVDCGSGLLADVKGTRPIPAGDAKENGLQSNCPATTVSVSNPVTSAVRECSDDVYAALRSDDALPRHHRRPSTDDNNDDVIKNENKTDVASSPSRDHGHQSDSKKTTEDAQLKRDVSELHSNLKYKQYHLDCIARGQLPLPISMSSLFVYQK